MSNNSALKKSNERTTFEKIRNKLNDYNYDKALLFGSAIGDFQSIGTAKTGGERLQKIGSLIAKAIAASGGSGG